MDRDIPTPGNDEHAAWLALGDPIWKYDDPGEGSEWVPLHVIERSRRHETTDFEAGLAQLVEHRLADAQGDVWRLTGVGRQRLERWRSGS